MTSVTKNGNDLTLRWDADMQGQSKSFGLTLTPDGEGLKATLDFGALAQVDGRATRAR